MLKNNLRVRTIVFALIFLAFVLRMFHVPDLLMWGDEGFSVYSANRDLYAITFEGKDVDPHPPLYYYLFHFYLPLAGFSELAIRFFSVFFGTATVALTYALATRLFDARVGARAALIAALAPFAVHYSQEVRMYALVIFLGALATYLFARLLEKETRARWVGFFSAMLLTQYTLYQAAFLFVAQGIFLLPFLKTRFRFILRWFASASAVVALFFPWLVTHSASAITDVKDVAGDTTPLTLPAFFARGFAAITSGTTIPLNNAMLIAALYAALILAAFFFAIKTRAAARHDWLLLALALIPILALYPIYFLAPLYRGRLFALACVPLIVLIARSLAQIAARARWIAIGLTAGIVAASAYSLSDDYFRYSRYNAAVDDYLPAIRAIQARAARGDAILFHAYWQIGYFLTHYHGAPIDYRELSNPQDIRLAVAAPRNVWAIVQGFAEHPAENFLAQNAFPLSEASYGAMRVVAYRAGAPNRAEKFSTPIRFDNGLALLGYRLNDAPIEAGTGAATIELEWQATRVIATDFTISVRLTDPRDEKILTQADRQMQNENLPTSQWTINQSAHDRQGLIVTDEVAPGEYALEIVLYNFKDSRVANIIAPENLRGQSLVLGRVAIIARAKIK
ncbi:MAG: glycosyltransferase family 39 protein [Chloroflexi bacterium]|nr:glycosyltransferase family 39 protein [Chloroflexota bacterium]